MGGTIVSLWRRGGWVNSEVFDHTSTIRFLEARFGVAKPNITPWHRTVAGDLTSCFDFAHPDGSALPELPDMSHATGETLVIEGAAARDAAERAAYAGAGFWTALFARAPYVLHAHAQQRDFSLHLEIAFENQSPVGAVFHVYDRLHLERHPRRYTVESRKALFDSWNNADDRGEYDLIVLGPNGFMRHFTGRLKPRSEARLASPEVRLDYEPFTRTLVLEAWNLGSVHCLLRAVPNVYPRDEPFMLRLDASGRRRRHHFSVRGNGNWYDFTLTTSTVPGWSRRFAGRMETSRHGVCDPALADGSAAGLIRRARCPPASQWTRAHEPVDSAQHRRLQGPDRRSRELLESPARA